MFCFAEYLSPIGKLTLACNESGELVGLWIEGQKYFMDSIPLKSLSRRETPVLERARDWLDRYFAGARPKPSELPLAPAGSAFRREVWRLLCEIPYGEVVTYGELAKKIAARRGADHMSAQAVGGAVGHNPVSVVIPCHRVVGSDGSLTGYAGGLKRKNALLTHERVQIDGLFVPQKGTAL